MTDFRLDVRGLKQLRTAIARNPGRVRSEAKKFLTRGIAVYNRFIMRRPWGLGQAGGGAPVDTGNLRDTHQREIGTFQARIFPTARYASYVHGIEGYPRKRSYQLRPWLDWAKKQGQREIDHNADIMLKEIVGDLAR